MKLLKYTEIINHAIKLEKVKQLLFKFFYSLKPVELKTLKIYIKNNIASKFIQLFKHFFRVVIFFDQKLNNS